MTPEQFDTLTTYLTTIQELTLTLVSSLNWILAWGIGWTVWCRVRERGLLDMTVRRTAGDADA